MLQKLALLSSIVCLVSSCRTSSSSSDIRSELSRSLIRTLEPAPTGKSHFCSFNIQFLGKAYERGRSESEVLLKAVENCTVIALQELIASPVDLVFPNGDIMTADPEAKIFFDTLAELYPQFAYILSPEDTGRWENHTSANYSEFFVFIYRKDILEPIDSPSNGFLQQKLIGFKDCDRNIIEENNFDRVPYAQTFRFLSGGGDFVLINAHLHADTRKPCTDQRGSTIEDIDRRGSELTEILKWIQKNDQGQEKDFILIGDLNLTKPEVNLLMTGMAGSRTQIQKGDHPTIRQKFLDYKAAGYVTLNSQCAPTNVGGDECFDHVIFRPAITKEIDTDYGMRVIDLQSVAEESGYCQKNPSICETTTRFIPYFTDHNPIVFQWSHLADDD